MPKRLYGILSPFMILQRQYIGILKPSKLFNRGYTKLQNGANELQIKNSKVIENSKRDKILKLRCKSATCVI